MKTIQQKMILVLMMLTSITFGLTQNVNAVFYVGIVTANTIISQPATNLSLNFNNSQSGMFNATAVNTNLSSTVKAIYGITTNTAVTPVTTNITGAGVSTNAFHVSFKNVSNINTNFKGYYGSFSTLSGIPGTLANWYFAFENYQVTNNVAYWDQVHPAHQNSYFDFTATVKPAANARNGSKVAIPIQIALLGNTASYYTGFDNHIYGGSTTANYTFETTISGPNLVLISRTRSITAPASYVSLGAGHNVTDAVPGAKINIQVVLQNQGSAAANNMVVVDKIPAPNTILFGPGNSYNDNVANVNFNCATQSNPPYTFSGTCNPSANITAIQFTTSSIGVNKFVTLNYSLTIK